MEGQRSHEASEAAQREVVSVASDGCVPGTRKPASETHIEAKASGRRVGGLDVFGPAAVVVSQAGPGRVVVVA